jgi:membrane fusion protein (multidrug efflux system)
MKLRSLLYIALLSAPMLRAEDEKPPTEVAVKVAKVIKTNLTRTVTAYGVIEPEPNSAGRPPASAKLAPAMAGIITEINGVEGQQVKKGDVLFKLDSRAVDAAVVKGEEAVAFAKKNSERQRKLIGLEGTSEKLVLEAEQALNVANTDLATAKVQQSLLRGEAPLDGTLVRFIARLGEPADIVTPLAEIVDLERLVATVRVPRAEASALKMGQKAKINEAEGTIAFISPQVDPLSDTVLVRLSLPKESGQRPGAFVTARIIVEERTGRFAVPFASVYTDPEGKSTLAIVEGGIATQKVVKAGLRDGDLIEVAGEGVSEGATVVTTGAFALPEQTKVRILNSTPAAK